MVIAQVPAEDTVQEDLDPVLFDNCNGFWLRFADLNPERVRSGGLRAERAVSEAELALSILVWYLEYIVLKQTAVPAYGLQQQ